MFRDFQDRWI